MSNNRKSNRRLPAAGPTPVGQRLRASTIQGHRGSGPSVTEWDYDNEDDES
jgi:hypothetical protein